MEIGPRLRELRRERGVSLAEVAEGTGISTSFLSFVETGKGDITVGRLMRLVKFYGLTLTDLFPDQETNDVSVVRHGDGKMITYGREHIEMSLLVSEAAPTMMPALVVFDAGAKQAEHTTHEGEEFAHVLQGELVVEVNGKEILLGEGDSIYFRADRPHTYRNPGRKPVRYISVTSPPIL